MRLRKLARANGERAAGHVRGSLHGVPVLIKDNIETADRLPDDRRLSRAEKQDSERDAPVVAALRAAGAIVLGKTNLSEWANYRSTHSTSGWSAVGGVTTIRTCSIAARAARAREAAQVSRQASAPGRWARKPTAQSPVPQA